MTGYKMMSIVVVISLLVGLGSIHYISRAEEKKEAVKMTHKIVTIGTSEDVQPKPTVITSHPGTTVIWVNYSSYPVELLFLDKKVTYACGTPVNFFVAKDGSYESTKIPLGGTASLCFIEKGDYPYLVKSSRTFYHVKTEYRGSIVIN